MKATLWRPSATMPTPPRLTTRRSLFSGSDDDPPLARNRTTAEAEGLPVASITLSTDDGTPACPVVSLVKHPQPITCFFENGADDDTA